MSWLIPVACFVPIATAGLMLAATGRLKVRGQARAKHAWLTLAQSVVVYISIWTYLAGRQNEELLFITIGWTFIAFLCSVVMLGLFFGKRPESN